MNTGRDINTTSTHWVANYLIDKLKAHGFIIHRYDAHSTASIYLKLDCGVAGSIRISDHKGYRYLHYTFNVETWRKKYAASVDRRGNTRYYYPPTTEMLDQLVEEAKRRADERRERYGEENYMRYVEENLAEGEQTTNGHTFWGQAKIVAEGKGQHNE